MSRRTPRAAVGGGLEGQVLVQRQGGVRSVGHGSPRVGGPRTRQPADPEFDQVQRVLERQPVPTRTGSGTDQCSRRVPSPQLLVRVVAYRDYQVVGSQHVIMCAVSPLDRQPVPTRPTATPRGWTRSAGCVPAEARAPCSTRPTQLPPAASGRSCVCRRRPPERPGGRHQVSSRQGPWESTAHTNAEGLPPSGPAQSGRPREHPQMMCEQVRRQTEHASQFPGATSPSTRQSTIASRDRSPSAACTLTRLASVYSTVIDSMVAE